MLDLAPFLPLEPLGQTEVVFVMVNGVRYTSFIRAQVRAGYKEAARAFEITAAAEPNGAVTAAIFRAGAEVKVFASGDLLMAGYVDQYDPHLSAREARIRVTGRSKSSDLIDSDADHTTGFFENKTPQEIGAELAKGYGATFETDQKLRKVDPSYTLTPGASIYREIEKLARKQGMTLAGTPEGNIRITKPNGSLRHAGGLFQGQNILVGNASHNWSNRHSKYIIKGQRPIGHGSRRLHLVAKAEDTKVNRKRVKSVVHDDDGSIDDLKGRAKNRRDRAAGEALKASISVQGFRDQAGMIWTPGALVWTESEFLNIAQDMLIEAVDYAQGPEGSISLLSLTDPRAFGGKGGKGNKSGAEWQSDDKDAVDLMPSDI